MASTGQHRRTANSAHGGERVSLHGSSGIQVGHGNTQNTYHGIPWTGGLPPQNSTATKAVVLFAFGTALWIVAPIFGIGAIRSGRRALEEIAVSKERGAGMARFSIVASRVLITAWAILVAIGLTAFLVVMIVEA